MDKHKLIPYILTLLLSVPALTCCGISKPVEKERGKYEAVEDDGETDDPVEDDGETDDPVEDDGETDTAVEMYTVSDLIAEGIKGNKLLSDGENISFRDNAVYLKPDTTDDELDELTGIIAEASRNEQLQRENAFLEIHCYSDNISFDLSEELSEKEIRSEFNGLIDEESNLAEKDFEKFHKKLREHDILYRSSSGEWFFIIDEHDYTNIMTEITDTIEDIRLYNPMYADRIKDNSFFISGTGENGEYLYSGFCGESIALYRNDYAPENKICERLMIDADALYDDVFRALIHDDSAEDKDAAEIDGEYEVFFFKGMSEYCIQFTWAENGAEISLDKLSDLTYDIYEKMHYATLDFSLPVNMNIAASAVDGEYDTYVESIYDSIDVSCNYTEYEWRQELKSSIYYAYREVTE